MADPRTVSELRAAVGRVLAARGEAADALRVTCDYYREDDVHRVAINDGRSEWIVRERPMVAEACGAVWADFVGHQRERLVAATQATDDAQEATDAAQRRAIAAVQRERIERAALAAACAEGGGDG